MEPTSRLRQLVREETDSECIERVRKQVRSVEKWGKWAATAYFVLGIATLLMAVCFGWFVKRVTDFAGNAANQGAAQPQDVTWLGFACGLVLGFIAGCCLLKSAELLAQGMKLLRGDRASALLLAYHDAVLEMLQAEREELDAAAVGPPPQVPPSADHLRSR